MVAVVSSTAASVSNRNEHANTLDTHKTRHSITKVIFLCLKSIAAEVTLVCYHINLTVLSATFNILAVVMNESVLSNFNVFCTLANFDVHSDGL